MQTKNVEHAEGLKIKYLRGNSLEESIIQLKRVEGEEKHKAEHGIILLRKYSERNNIIFIHNNAPHAIKNIAALFFLSFENDYHDSSMKYRYCRYW